MKRQALVRVAATGGLLVGLTSPSLGQVLDAAAVVGQFTKALDEAVARANGRLLVQVPGTPDETTVQAIAKAFEPTTLEFPNGTTAERIAQTACGHVSAAYLASMMQANPGRFANGHLTVKTAAAAVTLPACLTTRTTISYKVAPGDSIATIAKSVSGQEVGPSYCTGLQKLNTVDVCRRSQAGKLDIGTVLTLPKSSDQKQATVSFGVLTASATIGSTPDVVEELSSAIASAYNAAAEVVPETKPFTPDATPTTIVPTFTCQAATIPFSAEQLVDTIVRVQQAGKNKGIFQTKVTAGVIDTGLYDTIRTSFFERVPPGAADNVTNLIARTVEGTLARAYPGGTKNIAPEAGKYAGHGTHVAGLVVGGADFWDYLLQLKYPYAGTASVFATYVPTLIPIKVMSSPAAGLPPQTDSGQIANALSFLRKEALIINLSYTARTAPAILLVYRNIQENNKVLIIAAAGNDFEATGSLDDIPEDAAVLPAMLSGPGRPLAITVGALDETGKQAAPFSQRGHKHVDLFAPGTCVRSFGEAEPFKKDIAYSGTSQAAPLVTFAAAILYRFGVPLELVKERLLDTVDASDSLKDISISGGALNIAKALDYMDDIIVFSGDEAAAPYRRGRIVPLLDGSESPKYDANLCREAETVAQLRKLRRIVASSGGKLRWVKAKLGYFEYKECSPNPDLRFRLRATDGKADRDFAIADVREIVPIPTWMNASN